MMGKTMPGISMLRWILVLGAALIGALAADGLLHLANPELPFLADVLGGAAFHCVFVIAGTQAAPEPTRRATHVLALLSLLLAIALTTLTVVYAPSSPAWSDYVIGLGRVSGVALAWMLAS